jgi:hypothetical protein
MMGAQKGKDWQGTCGRESLLEKFAPSHLGLGKVLVEASPCSRMPVHATVGISFEDQSPAKVL